MSGQSIDNGKKKYTGLYIPLALEIFLVFLPFLVLGGMYLNRALKKELLSYESGLKWITVNRLLDTEVQRLEAKLDDTSLKELDLETFSAEEVLLDSDLEFSDNLLYGIRNHERRALKKSHDNIQVRYLYFDENGRLMELDVSSGAVAEIEEGSEYYKYAAMAFAEKVPDSDLMEVGYKSDKEQYYACFLPVTTQIPVRCGSILLSDGSEDSCIVLSGQLRYSVTEKMMTFYVLRATLIGYLALLAVLLVICITVFRALWGSRSIHRSIRSIRKGIGKDVSFEKRTILGSDTLAPEIRELLESFQLMFLSIQEYQDSISFIRELYEPLVPAALLSLFERKDIRDIRPGDTAYVFGTAMDIRIAEAEKQTADHGARNRYLKGLVEILMSAGMIITDLKEDRISAILPRSGADMSVSAREELIRRLHEADRTGSGAAGIDVSAAEGEFLYTVTGIEEHMSIRMDPLPPEAEKA